MLLDCKTGVLEGGKIEDTDPDPDCHKIFCDEHPERCEQVRALHIDEPESLGPYAARYFASKMWYGEEWFMQARVMSCKCFYTYFLWVWTQWTALNCRMFRAIVKTHSTSFDLFKRLTPI